MSRIVIASELFESVKRGKIDGADQKTVDWVEAATAVEKCKSEVFSKEESLYSMIHFTANKDSKVEDERLIKDNGERATLNQTELFKGFLQLDRSCNFYYLESICVKKSHRNRGIGREAMEKFIEERKDTGLIIGEIGLLAKEYPEDLPIDDISSIFARLLKFYYELGFVTLQPFYNYEGSFPIIYLNDVGVEFYRLTENATNEFDKSMGTTRRERYRSHIDVDVDYMLKRNERCIEKYEGKLGGFFG